MQQAIIMEYVSSWNSEREISGNMGGKTYYCSVSLTYFCTISQVKVKSRILPENGLETDFVLYLIDLSGIMGGYIVSVIL